VIVALAGPQWGFRWEEAEQKGVELVVALDVSKSMLAEDLKPNRLKRAQLAVQSLLDQLEGDRIGLVGFAGSAFLSCPLTSDYSAYALILNQMDTDIIPLGGTDLEAALMTALDAFSKTAVGAQAIVLMTDGEEHQGSLEKALTAARQADIKIFTVGLGSQQGELIPVIGSNGSRAYLKDAQGKVVQSRLNEALLQRIARETGGSYFRATQVSLGLESVHAVVKGQLQETTFDQKMNKIYTHRFQWPLALALFLLLAEAFLPRRGKDEN